MNKLALISLGSLALLAACASAPAPKELVDARAAYSRSAGGPAATIAPAQLHDAKVALERAEQAYVDHSDGPQTVDLAYVAERRAELADAYAAASQAAGAKDAAVDQNNKKTAEQLQKEHAELNQARQALNLTGEQLEQEKQRRKEAEKHAKEAMDKLAIAAALAVKEEPRGTVITLPGGVFFTSGKDTLLPTAQQKLNVIASALKDQGESKITVDGFTDSQGTQASNQELSERRAKSVRDYLVSQGVKGDQITSKGYGEDRPVADNKSPEGRANNRRVEIVVSPVEKR